MPRHTKKGGKKKLCLHILKKEKIKETYASTYSEREYVDLKKRNLTKKKPMPPHTPKGTL
jgi:hypothetical protein